MNIPKRRLKISLAMVMPALVSLSILMTMSIMVYIQYKNEKRSLYDTTMSLNLSSAQKMAVTIEALFSGMRQSLRAAASNPAIEARAASDEKELQVIFDLMLQSSPYFNSVLWADEREHSGRLSCGKSGKPCPINNGGGHSSIKREKILSFGTV